MTRTIVSSLFAVLLITAMLLSGCAQPPAPAAPTAAPAAPTAAAPAPAAPTAAPAAPTAAPSGASGGPTEIVLGSPTSLTGNMAGFTEGGVFGYKAAIEDINKMGGVFVKDLNKKLPIRAIIRDTESDPNKTASLAEQMIVSDKVDFMVRTLEPPHLSAPVATVTEKYKKIFVSGPGPYEPWVALQKDASPKWDHVWMIGVHIAAPQPKGDFREGQPGWAIMDVFEPLIKQLESKVSNKKIALMASDDADGRGWYVAFSGYMKDKGWEPYKADKELGILPVESTDYTPLIKEWMAAGCDTLWANCPGVQFGTMWRQANTLGFKPKLVYASRAAMFYSDIKAWGGDLPNAVVVETWWGPWLTDSKGFGDVTVQNLADRWTKATGLPANPQLGQGYQVVQVIVDAIERAGSLDTEKVNAALAKTDLVTMYGRHQFDENHFSTLRPYLSQWAKTDKPWVWEANIIVDFTKTPPETGKFVFPVPYK